MDNMSIHEIETKARELRQLQQLIEEAQAEAEAIRDQIKAHMGDSEELRAGEYIVDRAPRTIMYNENDGQHPSLNTFYQMVTMFDISVDQYFYPSKNKGSECRKRIDALLGSLDEKELKIVEATIQAIKAAKETEDA